MYQATAATKSVNTVPKVSRAPPPWMAVAVSWRNGASAATSCARIVCEPLYQRNTAPKMLQVPSVTMKGGSLT